MGDEEIVHCVLCGQQAVAPPLDGWVLHPAEGLWLCGWCTRANVTAIESGRPFAEGRVPAPPVSAQVTRQRSRAAIP
ncbi:hypothetical protein [Longispora albida]|uniref:hypothetical protein n=1 Tax=Longispora albida TaxID=203523 RepID=UPI0012F7CA11|nr:hypothetical protein [Longispora albida]